MRIQRQVTTLEDAPPEFAAPRLLKESDLLIRPDDALKSNFLRVTRASNVNGDVDQYLLVLVPLSSLASPKYELHASSTDIILRTLPTTEGL